MTESLYRSACAFAGRWLAPAQPWAQPAGRGMTATSVVAVYVICDWAGNTLYVGSTTCGVRNRVIAHMRNVDRTLHWTSVWVIPLADDTPLATVRRIEGLVGRALRPSQTRQLPAV